MKKIIAILTVVTITLLCCTGVLAYTLFMSCTCNFTITPSAKSVVFYNNAELTDVFANPHAVDFQTIQQGQVKSISWYLRNESAVATNLNYKIIGDTSWGTVTFSPSAFPKLMQPNEVYYLTMYITPSSTASLGTKSFTVEFADE